MAYDLKAASLDASMASGAVLFGADGQSAANPSVYDIAVVAAYILSTGFLSAGTNLLEQSNGANAQKFSVYNIAGTNYERFSIDWQAAANTLTLATEKGGTGTLRDMAVNVNANMTFSSVTGGGYQLSLQAGAAGVTNSNVAIKFRANSSDIGYVGRISSLFGFFASSGAKALTIDSSTGVATVAANTATPASGSSSAVLLFGTTSGFGIYYGSGAPTVSAAQGSIYLRSDGSSTSTRLYVNTTGSTTWTNFTSAA